MKVLAFNAYRAKIFTNCTIPGTPQHLSPTDEPGSSNANGGVGLLFHPQMPGFDTVESFSPTSSDPERLRNRYICARFQLDSTEIFIHAIYAPVSRQRQAAFFNALPRGQVFPSEAQHIVLGDLNIAIDPQLDSLTPRRTLNNAVRSSLENWLLSMNLVDPWRIAHPRLRIATAREQRVDYILLSDDLADAAYYRSNYVPPTDLLMGDHSAMKMTLHSNAAATGTGYWCLPWHLLHIPKVRNEINRRIDNLARIVDESRNPGLLWRSFKFQIKAYLQQEQRKNGNQRHQVQQRMLKELRRQVRAAPTAVNHEHLRRATIEYRRLQSYLDQARQDHAFARAVAQTERSSRFFLRRPSSHAAQAHMKEVRLPDGTVSANVADIQSQHTLFWQHVYGESSDRAWQDEDIEFATEEMLSYITRTLSTADQTMLDEEITVAEFIDAIKTSPRSSAPGPDGLPAEFYLINPLAFAQVLTAVFKAQLERQTLIPNQRKAIVSLLFKKGERFEPANFRPITLMQVDVKLYSRIINHRLMNILPKLIGQDQRGFIKGRHIETNLIEIQELQHIATVAEEPWVAQFLDFEKAYDRVAWDYLWLVMRRMNFGPRFIHMIQMCYDQVKLLLNINGHLVGPIKPQWGIKQGAPDSPALFTLAVEPLHQALRAARDRLSIPISPNLSKSVIAFADDTTPVARNLACAEGQGDLCHLYEIASNGKLSIPKCKAMYLDRNQDHIPETHLNLMRATDSETFLGVLIGPRVTAAQQRRAALQKFNLRLQQWQYRGRTIHGRVIIAHTMIYSVLWYVLNTVHIPTSERHALTKRIRQFVACRNVNTEAKSSPISESILHASPSDGGYGLIDVDTFINRNRIRAFQRQLHLTATFNEDCPWQWFDIPLLGFSTAWSEVYNAQGWDFLWLKFDSATRSALDVKLSDWWLDFLLAWHKLPTFEDWSGFSLERQIKYKLNIPIVRNHCQAWNLLPKPTQQQKRLHSRLLDHGTAARLGDFLTPSGTWPEFEEWQTRIQVLLQEILFRDQLQPLQSIYRKATQMVRTHIPELFQSSIPQWRLHTNEWRLWPWRLKLGDGTSIHLRDATSKDLYAALRPQPALEQHPLNRHSPQIGQLSTNQLKQIIGRQPEFRRWMWPKCHDILLRIQNRSLHLNYRFQYVQDGASPNCIHGCSLSETYQHLFWSCFKAQVIWRRLQGLFRGFLSLPLSWKHIITQDLPVHRQWSSAAPALLYLWKLLCGIILLQLWEIRNNCRFNEVPYPGDEPTWLVIEHSFKQHLRYRFKRETDSSTRQQLRRILNLWLCSPTCFNFTIDTLTVRPPPSNTINTTTPNH